MTLLPPWQGAGSSDMSVGKITKTRANVTNLLDTLEPETSGKCVRISKPLNRDVRSYLLYWAPFFKFLCSNKLSYLH
jgi:hypothetical protein